MAINITSGFNVYAKSPIDTRYIDSNSPFGSPYTSTASVCSSIDKFSRFTGLTVLVGTSSTQLLPQEYWWQTGISDSELVLKQSSNVGNITGSASNNYVALWTGTSSIGYDPFLTYNNNNNNGPQLLIGTTSQTSRALTVKGSCYLIGDVGIAGNSDLIVSRNAKVNSNLIVGNLPNGGGLNVINGMFDRIQVEPNGFISPSGSQTATTIYYKAYNNISSSDPYGKMGNIIGLNIQAGSTFSGYNYNYFTNGTPSFVDYGTLSALNLTINAGGTFSRASGLMITTQNINNIVNYADLLLNSSYPSGKWSIYSGGSLPNYLSGNLLIGYTQSQGTYSLQVKGNIYNSGNIYSSGNISASGSVTAQTGGFDSDIRLKSNIVYNPLIKGIDSIKSVSYIIGGNKHIGYIAQEVEDIVPSSIIKKDDGYLALNYNEVLVGKVAFLENRIKELSDLLVKNNIN